MDISPVFSETTILIGLLTPFATATLAGAFKSIRDGAEWVQGSVSTVAILAAALVIVISQGTADELESLVNQASGILAVHLTSWMMVTRQAVEETVDAVAFTLGRSDQ
jgi:hypothetical protein